MAETVLAENEAVPPVPPVEPAEPDEVQADEVSSSDAAPVEQGSPGAAIIRKLEAATGTRVVVYHGRGSMSQVDTDPLYRLLDAIGHQPRLALVIRSPGGDPDAAHLLSGMLHQFTDHLDVFVSPEGAYSAATLLALSADTLWMGPSSELSPIDPQVAVDPRLLIPTVDPQSPVLRENTIYVPAHVIRDFLELSGVTPVPARGGRGHAVDTSRLKMLLEPLLNPWILGWYERTDKVSRYYAKQSLEDYLLRGVDDAEGRANRIVATLMDDYASHEAGILRGPARKMGIPVSDCPEDAWTALEEMTDLYGRLPRNIVRLLETADGFEARTRATRTCGSCSNDSEASPDYDYCPSCGVAFERQCVRCKGALDSNWSFCARCGTSVADSDG